MRRIHLFFFFLFFVFVVLCVSVNLFCFPDGLCHVLSLGGGAAFLFTAAGFFL
ncbi:hypothetical protein MOQ_003463, partial [Trypanosoma cruzi marinkellei]